VANQDLLLLTNDEKAALLTLLKRAIDGDRFPLSPRIGTLRAILAKLEGPKPAPASFPRGGITHHHAPPQRRAKR
jgi:hypothetical protein